MSADYPKGYFDKSRKTAPSNIEAELDKIVWNTISQATAASINIDGDTEDLSEEIFRVAKTQLKQLILKDVLDLVGRDEEENWYNKDLAKPGSEYERKFMLKEAPKQYRNKLREQLRQSARKRYQ